MNIKERFVQYISRILSMYPLNCSITSSGYNSFALLLISIFLVIRFAFIVKGFYQFDKLEVIL